MKLFSWPVIKVCGLMKINMYHFEDLCIIYLSKLFCFVSESLFEGDVKLT